MFSACQSPSKCKCTGWKLPDEHIDKNVEANFNPKVTELCRNADCRHQLSKYCKFIMWIVSINLIIVHRRNAYCSSK